MRLVCWYFPWMRTSFKWKIKKWKMENTVYVYKWIVNSEKWKISNTGSHQNGVHTRALASIKYYYLFVIHYSLKYYLVFYNFSLFIFHFFWKKSGRIDDVMKTPFKKDLRTPRLCNPSAFQLCLMWCHPKCLCHQE